MPTLGITEGISVRVPPGLILSLVLAANASARVIELTDAGAPLTPSSYAVSPTVVGPFGVVKTFYVQAIAGAVTYDVTLPDAARNVPRFLAQSGKSVTCPADTTEDVLATVVIPGGTVGNFGSLRVWTLWSMTNNVNVKTGRVRLNGIAGTIFAAHVLTSFLTFSGLTRIYQRGVASSQVGHDPALITGGSAVAVATATIDMSVDVPLVITGQKATGGDSLVLEAYGVEVVPEFI